MFLFSCSFIQSLELAITNLFKHIATKTKYEPLVVEVSPLVIFACICFAWAYKVCPCKSKEKATRVLMRSMSMGSLHGGKLALQRLMDYHEARADLTSLHAAETELESSLADKHPDFKKLQRTIGKLEMSGKETKAVGILEKALENARKEGKPSEAYEIEMLLVEMFIYQGEFVKALQCKCLNDEKVSDARRPLYKAIIHILLDHPTEQAKKCWEDFKEIRRHFQSPPVLRDSYIHEVIMNFNKFEKAVKLLKHDIHAAN